jgi:hypothetical protein
MSYNLFSSKLSDDLKFILTLKEEVIEEIKKRFLLYRDFLSLKSLESTINKDDKFTDEESSTIVRFLMGFVGERADKKSQFLENMELDGFPKPEIENIKNIVLQLSEQDVLLQIEKR